MMKNSQNDVEIENSVLVICKRRLKVSGSCKLWRKANSNNAFLLASV